MLFQVILRKVPHIATRGRYDSVGVAAATLPEQLQSWCCHCKLIGCQHRIQKAGIEKAVYDLGRSGSLRGI
jgi:hypothetical protein